MSEQQTLQLATFDLNGDLEETDDFVIVRGKIFEAGEYPDKNFSITEEELADAVANFKPVPVDYSHVEGPLDGKLGEMRTVSLDPNNRRIALGEVAIPKWLDKVMGPAGRKVSCTWNRATKQIEKLALVNQPRIADAVLYAAFVDDQLEKFKANEEALFEGKRNSASDKQTIQKLHDHTVSLGAECSGDNVQYSDDPQPNPISDNKELEKVMNEENKTIDFKDSAEFKAQASEIEQMKAEMERMKAEKRHSDAVNTVEALLREGKAVPAERIALVAAFELAATDDAKNPVKVTFGEGEGQEGSRTDALKAVYAARPAHVLFGESVPVGGSVLFTQETPDPNKLSKDRVRELLAQSPLGQAVLEDNK